MSKLHDTLEKYIATRNIDPELKNYALADMENQIVQEIVAQKAAEIDKATLELQRKRMEQERHEKIEQRIKEAERTFWIVVVLGLMIGLAGNQITELVSLTKEWVGGSHLVGTIVVVGLLLLGAYLVFEREYIKTANDIITDFFRKGYEDRDA